MLKKTLTKQEMIKRINEEIEGIYNETTDSYEQVYIEAELDMYEYFLVLIDKIDEK